MADRPRDNRSAAIGPGAPFDRPLRVLNALQRATRDSDDPTQRVEAETTPEGAKGWETGQARHDVPAGGHGLDVAPDASPEGVRAETRRLDDRAGGEPSNAPTAAGTCPQSKRTDNRHAWRFDGDDPYIVCVYCGAKQDALTGRKVES